MVGNRELTDFGGELTKQLAYDFAKEGAIVVSGRAEGIDGKAHEGALEAGGHTSMKQPPHYIDQYPN